MVQPLSSVPMLFPMFIALAMARAERRIQRDLVTGGASTPETAIPLVYRRSIRRKRLERLVGAGAVHLVDGSRYYIDHDGWARYRSSRRRRAFIAISVVLALAGVALVAATCAGGLTSA